jgi:iron(III) transport system substrate-binding protein
VLHDALIITIVIARSDNALQPYGGLPSLGRLGRGFKADDLMVPVFTINYGILVNRNLVKPGEEPRSWADLADPKWKGKLLGDDPRAPGGGRVWFVATYDNLGAAFHEKMAAQDIKWAREYRESERRVARGEFPIYFPYILADNASLAGLPVQYVVPAEGVTYGAYAVSMLRNAPHPNAARLLMDFYLSDEVQTIYAREAHGVVVEGVLDQQPPDIRDLANAKLLTGNDVPERMDEMFAKAKEIYK